MKLWRPGTIALKNVGIKHDGLGQASISQLGQAGDDDLRVLEIELDTFVAASNLLEQICETQITIDEGRMGRYNLSIAREPDVRFDHHDCGMMEEALQLLPVVDRVRPGDLSQRVNG